MNTENRSKKKKGPRFCCMNCDELLPLEVTYCPNCGASVVGMKFNIRSNLRGAKLATQEEMKKRNEENEVDRRYRELCKKYANERKNADNKIVSVVIISTQNKKSGASTMGRAIVGNALFGTVGAIAGAASGKSYTHKVTFSIKYSSGRTSTETVNINSQRFRELSTYLH